MLWEGKAPTEIVERTWDVPTGDEDSLASFTATVTDATLDASENSGDLITLTISAGTAGETATVVISATTTNGLVITHTFYLPIRADGFTLSYTAREVCNMALRKIVGNGDAPAAEELDDALERLSDMLAGWAGEGADLQVKQPIEAGDTLFFPPWAIEGVKANLAIRCRDFYGNPLDASTVSAARTGLQRIKANLLPESREGEDYF